MHELRSFLRPLAACAAVVFAASAQAQAAPSRGQLLYATHCVECHTTQVHWRDQRHASDWESLKLWVRHWEREARLGWSDEDVDAVAAHLNATIYRFAQPQASAR